jgi:SseB protein N-terminal domain/SseB protein C-terminal domain
MSSSQAVIANPDLERAMDHVAKSDNAQTRESLYRAMLASTLIVSGRVSGDSREVDGGSVAGDNTRIALGTVESPAGNVILPAFTALDALVSFAGSEVQWVALGARALFQAILPGNIAEVRVNPFQKGQQITRPGGVITRREFTALAQGLLQQALISDNVAQLSVAAKQVLIGKPEREPPSEVLDRLTAFFKQFQDVQAGYLFQMGDQHANSTIFGVQFASMPEAQRLEPILRTAGAILQAMIPPDAFVDFMPVVPGAMLDAVRNSGRAIFQK